MKLPPLKESEVQKLIGQYLTLRKYPIWRNNAGKVQTLRGHWIQLAPKGTPDYVGYFPCFDRCTHSRCGAFVGIEFKREGKVLEQDQIRFAKAIRATKYGIYIVARDLKDVQEKLEGIIQGTLI